MSKTQTNANSKSSGFSVRITDFGQRGLGKIIRENPKMKAEINGIMKKLGHSPDMGKDLTSDLYGFKTIESKDRKYRIVYCLKHKNEVIVHAVGHRNRVYDNLARFLNRTMPYQ